MVRVKVKKGLFFGKKSKKGMVKRVKRVKKIWSGVEIRKGFFFW